MGFVVSRSECFRRRILTHVSLMPQLFEFCGMADRWIVYVKHPH